MIRSKTGLRAEHSTSGNLLREFNRLESGETPASVRQENIRWEVLGLLGDAKDEHGKNGESPKFMSKTNQIFNLLMKYFLPTVPPSQDQSLKEMKEMVFSRNDVEGAGLDDNGGYSDPRWMTCYNATFAVLVIRTALKDYNLPIVKANGWKRFATIYCGLVMAA